MLLCSTEEPKECARWLISAGFEAQPDPKFPGDGAGRRGLTCAPTVTCLRRNHLRGDSVSSSRMQECLDVSSSPSAQRCRFCLKIESLNIAAISPIAAVMWLPPADYWRLGAMIGAFKQVYPCCLSDKQAETFCVIRLFSASVLFLHSEAIIIRNYAPAPLQLNGSIAAEHPAGDGGGDESGRLWHQDDATRQLGSQRA